MNPFTESTVATPSLELESDWGKSCTDRPSSADCPVRGQRPAPGERRQPDTEATDSAPMQRARTPRRPTAARAWPRQTAKLSRHRDIVRYLQNGTLRRCSSYRSLLRSRSLTVCVASALGMVALVAPSLSQAVDVNRASAEQLETIRGIGPRTAQTIVQERVRGGPFESIDDLSDRVKGIGPKKAATLRASGLTVGISSLSSGIPPGARGASTSSSAPARASAPAPRK